MTRRPKNADRTQILEQRLASLESRLDQLTRRSGVMNHPQQVFWAKTWTESAGDYPTPDTYTGAPNKLPIVPIDRTWDKQVGVETAVDTRLRDIPTAIAYHDHYLPRDWRVLCMRDLASLKTYIVPNWRTFEGKVSEVDGIDFGSSGNVQWYREGVALTGVTVVVHYQWIEWASNLPKDNKIRFVWDYERNQFEALQHECA